MEHYDLLDVLIRFALAAGLGFVIGLEREMGTKQNPHAGLRDFVLFALIGAISAFAASLYQNSWLIVAGFAGFIALLLTGYWSERRVQEPGVSGITTEAAAIITFFLGVLVVREATALAIAIAIGIVAILSQKQALKKFSAQLQRFELDAAVKLLVISFIVLPILPQQTLDTFLTYPLGTVTAIDRATDTVELRLDEAQIVESGQLLTVYDASGAQIGDLEITNTTTRSGAVGVLSRATQEIEVGTVLETTLAPPFVMTMLSAIKPFKIWLIVVLVSFISFVGYVLIKIMGRTAGISWTGLIGGLASSTVTTVSFAKRSREQPNWNQMFAVAVLLASSIMFPRLMVQIGLFNQPLMRNMALPIMVTGATGVALAIFFLLRSKSAPADDKEVSFGNPFSLKSAIIFGAVFALTLMVTRCAIVYLGDAWLPLIAVISGLTDADAIAFSLSDAQKAGLISLDWASFNLVLGALSNTFMKLFLVFALGHPGLFKRLLASFSIMGATGILTTFLYYDLG